MRATPIIGTKVWFAPRGFGDWGWTPVSWEGWATHAVLVLAAVLVGQIAEPDWLVILGCLAALVGICFLKGTSPGGGVQRAEFERGRRGRLIHGGGDDSPRIADIVHNWDHWDDAARARRWSRRWR